MQVVFTEEMIYRRTWVLVVGVWEAPSWPPFCVTLGIGLHDADVDELRETLEMTNEVGPMCKWTKESDVEVIAAFFGGNSSLGMTPCQPSAVAGS